MIGEIKAYKNVIETMHRRKKTAKPQETRHIFTRRSHFKSNLWSQRSVKGVIKIIPAVLLGL